MNERATIASIVLLLAAGGLMQATSPAALAAVGTYVAIAGEGDGAVHHVLALGGDATATLRTVSPDGRSELSAESGTWIASGATIQIMLADPSDVANPTALTLETRDGALVPTEVEGSRSRFAGLTFARASEAPPAPDPK